MRPLAAPSRSCSRVGELPAHCANSEPGRYAVLNDTEKQRAAGSVNAVVAVVANIFVIVAMTGPMVVVLAPTEQPGACNVHGQTETGNRNGLSEIYADG